MRAVKSPAEIILPSSGVTLEILKKFHAEIVHIVTAIIRDLILHKNITVVSKYLKISNP